MVSTLSGGGYDDGSSADVQANVTTTRSRSRYRGTRGFGRGTGSVGFKDADSPQNSANREFRMQDTCQSHQKCRGVRICDVTPSCHAVRARLPPSCGQKQKKSAGKRGCENFSVFRIGDRVLLSTEGIKDASVTNLGTSKLAPRFIGPFTVIKVLGDAYTLDISSNMRLHPTFYVGRLKRCYLAQVSSVASHEVTSAEIVRPSHPPSGTASQVVSG